MYRSLYGDVEHEIVVRNKLNNPTVKIDDYYSQFHFIKYLQISICLKPVNIWAINIISIAGNTLWNTISTIGSCSSAVNLLNKVPNRTYLNGFMIYDKESICFLSLFKVAVLNGSLAQQAAVTEGAKYMGKIKTQFCSV